MIKLILIAIKWGTKTKILKKDRDQAIADRDQSRDLALERGFFSPIFSPFFKFKHRKALFSLNPSRKHQPIPPSLPISSINPQSLA